MTSGAPLVVVTPDSGGAVSAPCGEAGALADQSRHAPDAHPLAFGDESGAAVGQCGVPATAPHVIGIDLSLTSTGVACPHGCDTIPSTGHKGATLIERDTRLRNLKRSVLEWCITADLVVIEAPSYSSQHGSMHDRSGLWWLIVSSLIFRSTPVAMVAPAQRAKYVTGKGNAGKDAVIVQVTRRFPGFEIGGNDEADAVALMAMGLDHLGHPLALLPDAHRAVLAKVDWPVIG